MEYFIYLASQNKNYTHFVAYEKYNIYVLCLTYDLWPVTNVIFRTSALICCNVLTTVALLQLLQVIDLFSYLSSGYSPVVTQIVLQSQFGAIQEAGLLVKTVKHGDKTSLDKGWKVKQTKVPKTVQHSNKDKEISAHANRGPSSWVCAH